MKPKEQVIATINSFEKYLPEWVNALNKLTFSKGSHFKASENTAAVLKEKLQKDLVDTTSFKEIINYPGGEKIIFILEIMPFVSREDFDGIWIFFEENNIARFADMDYGHLEGYLKENDIKENQKITWQEAYDKLCDLARKEQTIIPKLQ